MRPLRDVAAKPPRPASTAAGLFSDSETLTGRRLREPEEALLTSGINADSRGET